MNKLSLLILSILGVLFTVGCEEKKDSDFLLFIKPESQYLQVNEKERIDFSIECTSSGKITNFRIGEKSSDYATDYFFDTIPESKDLNFDYTYYVPENAPEEITLLFHVENETGKEAQLARKLFVSKVDTLLKETTGHTFYSALSEEADGYNLLEKQPVFTAYADSQDVHIYDASADSLHGDNLSGRWETKTDVKFVKYNDFDYANATNLSIQNAYESGIKKEFAGNIRDNDLIILNIQNKALAAIKVIAVFDPDSTHNDRYIFNMKK